MVDVSSRRLDLKLIPTPRRAAARTGPTLSNYRFTDWFDWYYDCATTIRVR